jgi:hypothetical protein
MNSTLLLWIRPAEHNVCNGYYCTAARSYPLTVDGLQRFFEQAFSLAALLSI